ncbi:Crossover junction endonuclease mus81 [Xylographa opegraphella]|nr:Crossover junction endonuclease mus81 [Xylographa opegraphella]
MAECANPLLVQWLKEFLDEARQRNTKGVTVYKNAYESMKACPIVWTHPNEAQALRGLGPKVCARLTDRLREHCTDNGLPMPTLSRKKKKRSLPDDQPDPSANPEAPAKKARKPKPYIPALRSGAYAIVLALSALREHASSDGMTKPHLIENAQPHCDSSFTLPSDPTKFYTAWASMKTLQDKDLVYEWGRPTKRYRLSEEGWDVAKKIKATAGDAVPPALHTDGPVLVEPTERTLNNVVDLEDVYDDEDTSLERAIRASLEDQASKGQLAVAMPRRTSSNEARSRSRPSLIPSQTAGSTDFLELLSSPENGRSRQSRAWAGSGTDVHDTSLRRGQKPIVSHAATRSKPNAYPDSTLPFQPLRVAPGTFTVELVLDNREVRTKTDRDYIQEELRIRKIQPIVRPLDLGDALWVAKCKDPQLLPRLGEEGDEVILDWIVERKRLDDLISSIKDGRFLEQKFRMHKSGIKNVIYVIEDFAMNSDNTQNHHEHVRSAISSTQVVNGYFVKRTRQLDDTIRYLARMTMLLKTLYEVSLADLHLPPALGTNIHQSKPLLLIPSPALSPTTYLPLLSSLPTPHHITYASFASLVSKSDSLTLRDVFLKMLMCTRGITGDKAVEIQRHWQTPCAFVEALQGYARGADLGLAMDAEARAKRRRELVWKVAGGFVGPRKIGKAVGAKVAEIWGEP